MDLLICKSGHSIITIELFVNCLGSAEFYGLWDYSLYILNHNPTLVTHFEELLSNGDIT